MIICKLTAAEKMKLIKKKLGLGSKIKENFPLKSYNPGSCF